MAQQHQSKAFLPVLICSLSYHSLKSQCPSWMNKCLRFCDLDSSMTFWFCLFIYPWVKACGGSRSLYVLQRPVLPWANDFILFYFFYLKKTTQDIHNTLVPTRATRSNHRQCPVLIIMPDTLRLGLQVAPCQNLPLRGRLVSVYGMAMLLSLWYILPATLFFFCMPFKPYQWLFLCVFLSLSLYLFHSYIFILYGHGTSVTCCMNKLTFQVCVCACTHVRMWVWFKGV